VKHFCGQTRLKLMLGTQDLQSSHWFVSDSEKEQNDVELHSW
jgi:hypothetical protein